MSAQTVEQLWEQVGGEVDCPRRRQLPEGTRVLNAMIDRRPAAVSAVGPAADVVAAVDFARENQLDLAVRGGGRGVPGFGTVDDGVVVDLTAMQDVAVDPGRHSAQRPGRSDVGRVQRCHACPRSRDHRRRRLHNRGRWAHSWRRHRLPGARFRSIARQPDLSAEVVTADGRSLGASESENEDLVLAAIRGGGENSASSPRLSSAFIRSKRSTAGQCSSRWTMPAPCFVFIGT